MKLDVIKYSKFYVLGSLVVILAGIAAMLISWQTTGFPLKPGIDFTGGTRLIVGLNCTAQTCKQPIDIGVVRQAITAKGYGKSVIQLIEGNDLYGISIQTVDLDTEQRTALQKVIQEVLKPVGEVDAQKSQIEKIGPAIGAQLLTTGLMALLVSFAGIACYLAVRFEADYAFFAILALLHDVLVTVGVFAVLGLIWGVEVDSLFIVALLTICGFSVNDTVVIYDRIRENLKNASADTLLTELVNSAVNQSLARSINTTWTTVLPLLAILLFGGATLKFFALALLIGFLAGTYSSIFNASILWTWWRNARRPKTVSSA
ncbi:MAG: protein translocase subunit SecF [Pseudanabaenaceae cyanobacterium]